MVKISLLGGAITLVLLLVTFSATQTTAYGEAVLDSDGNPLEVGSGYYIQPAGFGFRGGIKRSPKSSDPDQDLGCPLYAVEAASEVDRGQPLTFIPADETQTQILVSSDIKIDSGSSAYCRDNGLWRVTLDALNRRDVVIASGAFGVSSSLFKIEKVDGAVGPAYKINHCPSPTGVPCGDLTVFKDFFFDVKLLGITNNSEETLEVYFVKKSGDEQSVVYRADN